MDYNTIELITKLNTLNTTNWNKKSQVFIDNSNALNTFVHWVQQTQMIRANVYMSLKIPIEFKDEIYKKTIEIINNPKSETKMKIMVFSLYTTMRLGIIVTRDQVLVGLKEKDRKVRESLITYLYQMNIGDNELFFDLLPTAIDSLLEILKTIDIDERLHIYDIIARYNEENLKTTLNPLVLDYLCKFILSKQWFTKESDYKEEEEEEDEKQVEINEDGEEIVKNPLESTYMYSIQKIIITLIESVKGNLEESYMAKEIIDTLFQQPYHPKLHIYTLKDQFSSHANINIFENMLVNRYQQLLENMSFSHPNIEFLWNYLLIHMKPHGTVSKTKNGPHLFTTNSNRILDLIFETIRSTNNNNNNNKKNNKNNLLFNCVISHLDQFKKHSNFYTQLLPILRIESEKHGYNQQLYLDVIADKDDYPVFVFQPFEKLYTLLFRAEDCSVMSEKLIEILSHFYTKKKYRIIREIVRNIRQPVTNDVQYNVNKLQEYLFGIIRNQVDFSSLFRTLGYLSRLIKEGEPRSKFKSSLSALLFKYKQFKNDHYKLRPLCDMYVNFDQDSEIFQYIREAMPPFDIPLESFNHIMITCEKDIKASYNMEFYKLFKNILQVSDYIELMDTRTKLAYDYLRIYLDSLGDTIEFVDKIYSKLLEWISAMLRQSYIANIAFNFLFMVDKIKVKYASQLGGETMAKVFIPRLTNEISVALGNLRVYDIYQYAEKLLDLDPNLYDTILDSKGIDDILTLFWKLNKKLERPHLYMLERVQFTYRYIDSWSELYPNIYQKLMSHIKYLYKNENSDFTMSLIEIIPALHLHVFRNLLIWLTPISKVISCDGIQKTLLSYLYKISPFDKKEIQKDIVLFKRKSLYFMLDSNDLPKGGDCDIILPDYIYHCVLLQLHNDQQVDYYLWKYTILPMVSWKFFKLMSSILTYHANMPTKGKETPLSLIKKNTNFLEIRRTLPTDLTQQSMDIVDYLILDKIRYCTLEHCKFSGLKTLSLIDNNINESEIQSLNFGKTQLELIILNFSSYVNEGSIENYGFLKRLFEQSNIQNRYSIKIQLKNSTFEIKSLIEFLETSGYLNYEVLIDTGMSWFNEPDPQILSKIYHAQFYNLNTTHNHLSHFINLKSLYIETVQGDEKDSKYIDIQQLFSSCNSLHTITINQFSNIQHAITWIEKSSFTKLKSIYQLSMTFKSPLAERSKPINSSTAIQDEISTLSSDIQKLFNIVSGTSLQVLKLDINSKYSLLDDWSKIEIGSFKRDFKGSKIFYRY
ncbi:hypothetical protein DLAC_03270 [Tieghemostelium lacteum]|uniref:Uncharacterized protein n=1 Tax=Tieghemostelium lacteum TaxID=361077 RepID=A0A152A1M8_TIELA|nr:hypothetical protein DLAC_03270 [Tieghemostelium lacteum]|eukprot:KYR00120.1 hypothetical protein DLAC_03270 [Tieghemostelium lacteum]